MSTNLDIRRVGKSSRRRFNDWFIPYARATLADWRARHPLIRAVEPLPIDEQTEQANQAALNIDLQEQWWRDYLYYFVDHLDT